MFADAATLALLNHDKLQNMQLKDIDKAIYRKHLNIVIWATIVTFGSGALLFSTLLITFFADDQGTNFKFNLAGVIAAGFLVTTVLLRFKRHPFLHEVAYVWDLKQELLQINRRITKLNQAAAQGEREAMIALNYCYQGSKQLWQLDDNTITMEELEKKMALLKQQMEEFQIEVSMEEYRRELLSRY